MKQTPRAVRWGWAIVGIVTALRAALAALLPLTGDEAYYWEWSRRLAGGYADHPPGVALTIAAFGWLGRDPFAVRIGFVLCGLGAAIFAGAAATRLAGGDRRAGAAAAAALTLAPMVTIAFGMASPDGPYLFCWSAATYLALRAFDDRRIAWFLLLGIALGCALETRFFAFALALGIAVAALLRRDKALALGTLSAFAVAGLLWVPFLVWNAQHAWMTFRFTFEQRHEIQILAWRPFMLYLTDAIAFSPGLWIAATAVAIRTRNALVRWSVLPFCALLFAMAIRERVEVYWFEGPYLSLTIALGAAFARRAAEGRRTWIGWTAGPAAVLSAAVFVAALAPGAVYAGIRTAGLKLENGGPFEIFTYRALAADVRRIAAQRQAVVMTDGYGLTSLLDFYGGLTPVLIGYDPQGEEGMHWYPNDANPHTALFVDKEPFATRPDFERQFARACGRVVPGPTLSYAFDPGDRAVPPRRYFLTWCLNMRRGAIAVLRWRLPPRASASASARSRP